MLNSKVHSTDFNKQIQLSHRQVFIGGRNRLYQLSPDLDLVAQAITGPKNDTKDCNSNDCSQNSDNVNKVLLIDYATSRLITCGTILQGSCSVRSMQNVSHVEQELPDAVVASSESEF